MTCMRIWSSSFTIMDTLSSALMSTALPRRSAIKSGLTMCRSQRDTASSRLSSPS